MLNQTDIDYSSIIDALRNIKISTFKGKGSIQETELCDRNNCIKIV